MQAGSRARRGHAFGALLGLLCACLVVVAERSAGATTPTRIMPLGDSITDGGSSGVPGAYRIDLEDRLAAGGYPLDFVGSLQNGPPDLADKDHEGHAGHLIADTATGANAWLSQSAPDVVLLMIGTNDIRFAADLAGTAGRLGGLLDQIAFSRPSAHVIVAKIPPITGLAPDRQQALIDYNNAIPGLVSIRANQGKRISLVDMQTALGPGDLIDGVHPNSAGYTKMGGVWYGGLTGVLPSTGTTFLSDLNPTSAVNGYGPYERDRSNGGPAAGDGRQPMSIRGTPFAKGLGTHANSSLTYNLGGAYATFLADVGLDDAVGPDGAVAFQVFADGAKIYDSGKMTWAQGPRAVNVSVAGRNTLQLVVTEGGDGTSYDHADWGGARLTS